MTGTHNAMLELEKADRFAQRVIPKSRLFSSSPPRGKKVRRSLLLERCKFLPGNSLCEF
jgi:hypothetical protein